MAKKSNLSFPLERIFFIASSLQQNGARKMSLEDRNSL